MQKAVAEDRLSIKKIPGTANAADIGTKHVPAETLFRHAENLRMKFPKS